MNRVNITILAGACLFTGLLTADTLRFRNGQVIQGTLLGSNSKELQFLGADGSPRAYSVSGVAAIEFSAPTPPPPPPTPPPPPAPTGLAVPGGTRITVRLIDSIDSTKTRASERFRASIDDPIIVGSTTVIPRGATCTVQIIEADANKELSIKLYDITLNGKAYDVVSSYAELQATGTSKKKKAMRRGIGLGAAGAGIGALAGGGQGAAIGAAVGVGLGAVSGATAKGKSLNLPSETRLTFDLRAPLTL